MKDFIILTNEGGTIMSGTDIQAVLRTYKLMFDDNVIGIVEYGALIKVNSTAQLISSIGLS